MKVHAANLNVNRRGHALIQHGIDEATRLEIGAQFGNFLVDLFAHSFISSKLLMLMFFFQPNLDKRRVHRRNSE